METETGKIMEEESNPVEETPKEEVVEDIIEYDEPSSLEDYLKHKEKVEYDVIEDEEVIYIA